MMGKQVMAEPLFYTFWLEDHVPAAHPLRAVDALLDTAFIRRVAASHYSAIGRPSIDPELMIRMLLVGYLGGIRSERRWCSEAGDPGGVTALVRVRQCAAVQAPRRPASPHSQSPLPRRELACV